MNRMIIIFIPVGCSVNYTTVKESLIIQRLSAFHTQCHEILATGDYARYAKFIQDESTVTIPEYIEKNIVDWIAAL